MSSDNLPAQDSNVQPDLSKMDITKMIKDTKMVLDAFNKFKDPNSGIIDRRDISVIQGTPFIKKKGWEKIAMAFSIRTKIEEEKIEKTEDGNYIVRFRVSATSPWFVGKEEDIGVAEKREFDLRNELAQRRGKNSIPFTMHNLETLAYARAYNRVISKFVGGGELSAEEVTVNPDDDFPVYNITNTNTSTNVRKATQKQLEYIDNLSHNFDTVIIKEDITFEEANKIINDMKQLINQGKTTVYRYMGDTEGTKQRGEQ